MIDIHEAFALLQPIGQSHLLKYWEGLPVEKQKHLLAQIEQLDLATFHAQQELLERRELPPRQIEPVDSMDQAGNGADREKGKELIAQGQVGCLIMAGGQATRLRIEGPKGICPITCVRHKSLFQLMAEKVVAAGKQAKKVLPVAIMTSPLNHEATVQFFEKNQLFGLEREQLTFFPQKMLPILDERGNLFLETQSQIAAGPNGNGDAITEFYKQEVWHGWWQRGVRYVNCVLVDNPLADPFDAELIGYHQRKGGEVVVKATWRESPEENVGVLVKEKGRLNVVEYTECDRDALAGRNQKGEWLYPFANISLFSFAMDFIKQVASDTRQPLPLHQAHKAVPYLNDEGVTIHPDAPNSWKFEKFIFDLLPRAAHAHLLVYPRSSCFAPLKQFSGKDSFETVTAAIEAEDRRMIEQVTHTPCLVRPLEISQDFYYPTLELIQTWQGRTIALGGYIEAALKSSSHV